MHRKHSLSNKSVPNINEQPGTELVGFFLGDDISTILPGMFILYFDSGWWKEAVSQMITDDQKLDTNVASPRCGPSFTFCRYFHGFCFSEPFPIMPQLLKLVRKLTKVWHLISTSLSFEHLERSVLTVFLYQSVEFAATRCFQLPICKTSSPDLTNFLFFSCNCLRYFQLGLYLCGFYAYKPFLCLRLLPTGHFRHYVG